MKGFIVFLVIVWLVDILIFQPLDKWLKKDNPDYISKYKKQKPPKTYY